MASVIAVAVAGGAMGDTYTNAYLNLAASANELGTITVSDSDSTPGKLVDGSVSSSDTKGRTAGVMWQNTTTNNFNASATFTFSSADGEVVNAYAVHNWNSATYYARRVPTAWVLYGSQTGNDDDWTPLHTVTGESWTKDIYKFYPFENSTAYKHYKIVFSDTPSNNELRNGFYYLVVTEWELYHITPVWTGGGDGTSITDAGNWGGTPGEKMVFDANETYTINKAATICVNESVTLGGLNITTPSTVTFTNPEPDAQTGAVTTNTIALAQVSNLSTGTTTFDCAVRFTGTRKVHLPRTGSVDFHGGVAAKARFVEQLEAGVDQNIVCYGTSITAGTTYDPDYSWADGLSNALARAGFPGNATVVNSGLSGRNSATGLEKVQEKVVEVFGQDAHADAVFIEFSMNDAADSLNNGKTPAQALEDAEANLKAIILAITNDNPNCEIILQTMNPFLPGHKNPAYSSRTDLEEHFEMYRRVAAEGGFLLVDNYPKWKSIFDDSESEFLDLVPDGLHPNRRGYDKVVVPDVLAAIGLPAWTGGGNTAAITDAGNWGGTAGVKMAFEPGMPYYVTQAATIEVDADAAIGALDISGAGAVTFTNPAADAQTGVVTTNTITLAKIFNSSSETATFNCAIQFTDTYDVTLTSEAHFPGGVTATCPADGITAQGAAAHAITGHFTFTDDWTVAPQPQETPFVLTDGSTLTGRNLTGSGTTGKYVPNLRIAAGAYAHFTSATLGTDIVRVSVLGTLEIDDYLYCYKRSSSNNPCMIGLTTECEQGGILKVGGLSSDNANDYKNHWHLCVHDTYIGANGVYNRFQDYSLYLDDGVRLHAIADMTIGGSDGSKAISNGTGGLNFYGEKVEIDTDEWTVTLEAPLTGSHGWTKKGIGTLILKPCVNKATGPVTIDGGTVFVTSNVVRNVSHTDGFGTGAVTVNNGATLVVDWSIVLPNAVTLAAGSTIALSNVNERASAALIGMLTVSGAATVAVSGTLPAENVTTNITLAAHCDAATLANLTLDKSALVNGERAILACDDGGRLVLRRPRKKGVCVIFR